MLRRLTRIAPGLALVLLASAALAAPSAAQQPRSSARRAARRPTAKITVTWLGHAAFLVTSPGGTQLLIDPFLRQNPSTPDSLKDSSRYHPAAILVTHSHFDHSADAKAIAQASGAPIVASYDWAQTLGLPAEPGDRRERRRHGQGRRRRDPRRAGDARERARRAAARLRARVRRRPAALRHRRHLDLRRHVADPGGVPPEHHPPLRGRRAVHRGPAGRPRWRCAGISIRR